MNFANAERLFRTILYEGYMLYPYNGSALKNSQPCMLGTLFPKTGVGSEPAANPSSLQLECLAVTSPSSVLHVRLAFLQFSGNRATCAVSRAYRSGYRAIERRVECGPVVIHGSSTAIDAPFRFEGTGDECLQGRILLGVHELKRELFKIVIRVENLSRLPDAEVRSNSPLSIASAQLILGIESGEFLSLLDPPKDFRKAASECENRGVFPVLVGESGTRNMLFAPPVILYDYPEIAAESWHDFFDSTEIDELLTLRVMTMTEEEKAQAKVDPLVAQVLDQADAASPKELSRLHGTFRNVGIPSSPPKAFASESLNVPFQPGDRVRLWPRQNADIMDIVLKGQVGIVESTQTDFEGRVHVAVVMEDDPGKELGFERYSGHRFFFAPDELESLSISERNG
jgi:hypothetical protein